MKKALTIAILGLVLLGTIAIIPQRASAATSSDWTVLDIDLTKVSKVPGNIVYPVKFGTKYGRAGHTIELITGEGLRITSEYGADTLIIGVTGFLPVPECKIIIRAKFESTADESGSTYFWFHYGGTITTAKALGGPTLAIQKSSTGRVMCYIDSSAYVKNTTTDYYDGKVHTITIDYSAIKHKYNLSIDGNVVLSNVQEYNIPDDTYPVNFILSTMYIQPFITVDGYTQTFTLVEVKQVIKRSTITVLPKRVIGLSFDEIVNTTIGWSSFDDLDKFNVTSDLKAVGGKATLFTHLGTAQTPSVAWPSKDSTVYTVSFHEYYDLTTLTQTAAEENITKAFTNYYNKYGRYPGVWCALSNGINSSHIKYTWSNYQSLARNYLFAFLFKEDLFTQTPYGVNTIDDYMSNYFDSGAVNTIAFTAYTHDVNTTTGDYKTSVSGWKTFYNWTKKYDYKIVDLETFYSILKNQVNAYFDIQKNENGVIEFVAHTNGAPAYVNVNFHGSNIKVVDLTTGKEVKWYEGSVEFWVEDGHTYKVYSLLQEAINTGISLVNIYITFFIVMMVLAIVLSFGKSAMNSVTKAVSKI